MPSYKVSDLINRVRIALDENGDSGDLVALSDIDTLTLNDIIKYSLLDAARIVETNAPSYLLDAGESFASQSVIWKGSKGYGAGTIVLPEDFMRLVSFKMSDWTHSVNGAVTQESEAYLMQQSEYPGIRGCPQKPVVAIINAPAGLSLEFYSCMGGAGVSVEHAQYLPYPNITYGSIDLCRRLKDAIVYYAAYLTAQSLNNEQLATKMLSISNNIQG